MEIHLRHAQNYGFHLVFHCFGFQEKSIYSITLPGYLQCQILTKLAKKCE